MTAKWESVSPRSPKGSRQVSISLLVPGLYHLELLPPSPSMEFKTQQFPDVLDIFLGLLMGASSGFLWVYPSYCQKKMEEEVSILPG